MGSITPVMKQLLFLLPFLRAINAQTGCKADIDDSCTPFSTEFGTGTTFTDEVVIPCGKCITMSGFVNGETLVLSGGLLVDGSLHFPSGLDMTLNTTHFVTEKGEVHIESTSRVFGTPDVTINMIGTEDVVLSSGEILGPGAIATSNVGVFKATGYPALCPTFSSLKKTYTADLPSPPATSYPTPNEIPEGCTKTLMASGDFLDVWFPSLGADFRNRKARNSMTISNRKRTWQGAYAPLDAGIGSCIVPDKPYILTAGMKLTETNSSNPSLCINNNTHCPIIATHTMSSDGRVGWKTIFTLSNAAAAGNDEWFDLIATVTFSESDLTSDNIYSILYIAGPEAGIDLTLRDVSLIAPPHSAFPPSTDTCKELIRNGGADAAGSSYFPWYTKGSSSAGLTIVDAEGDGNMMFKLGGRDATYAALGVELAPACIEQYSTHEFTARVQVKSDELSVVTAYLRTTDADGKVNSEAIVSCPPSRNFFVDCKASFMFGVVHASARTAEVLFVTDDAGANSDLFVDGVSFLSKERPVGTIVVDPDAIKCWGRGADIVVTSFSMDASDAIVTKIKSITSESEGVAVSLDSVIPNAPSLATTSDFAVEVALLSRMIQINGGHFIDLNSAGVTNIRGVEFNGMGKEGSIDNYPLQIVGGTNIKKIYHNSIRSSSNRCIVLESSTGVWVEGNVAYDTFGHCYTLDKMSSSNTFTKNLGSYTKIVPPAQLASIKNTDIYASTFWSANPMNDWSSNIAAGSEENGFWFEIDEAHDTATLGVFTDNIFHSNGGDGLKFYPNGFYPAVQSVVTNTKSYVNRGYGIMLHGSENVKVNGGLYSDNRHGISLRKADGIIISGAKIIGLSDNYASIVSGFNKESHCPAYRSLVGIQLHSSSTFTTIKGSLVEKVTFENLTAGKTGCVGSTAMEVDPVKGRGFSDMQISVSDITVTPTTASLSEKITLCAVSRAGATHMSIADGGQFNPAGSASGTIVSNSTAMRQFATGCEPMEGACALYCPSTKYDTMTLATSPAAEYDDIVLTATADGITHVIKGTFDTRMRTTSTGAVVKDFSANTLYSRRRYYQVTLPAGHEYTLSFMKGNTKTWPRFVETNPDVVLPWTYKFDSPLPSDECSTEAILNKDHLNNNFDHWYHTGNGLRSVRPGYGTTWGISTAGRQGGWQGFGQFLDTRCYAAGETIEIMAKFRLFDKSNTVMSCEPSNGQYLAKDSCPRLTLVLRKMGDPKPTTTYIYPVASAVGPVNIRGWGELHGLLTVPQVMADADSIFLMIEGGMSSNNVALAGVTLSPKTMTCADVEFNRNFETAKTTWWTTNGDARIERVSGGYNTRSKWSMKTTFRDTHFSSMAQVIYPNCISEGLTIVVSVYMKLMKGTEAFNCDPSLSWETAADLNMVCPTMNMKLWKDGAVTDNPIATFTTFTAGRWNKMESSFVVTPEMATADKILVHWEKVVKEVTIHIDDFAFGMQAPTGCGTLVHNGDFEEGNVGMWKGSGGASLSAVAGGYEGSAFALKSTNRDSMADGVIYPIQVSCINRRVLQKVTARVKMLDRSGAGVMCNFGTTNDESSIPNQMCPHIYMTAQAAGSAAQERIIGGPITGWVVGEYNYLVGYFTWLPNEWFTTSLYLMINGAPPGVDLFVDDVTISVVTEVAPPAPVLGKLVNFTDFAVLAEDNIGDESVQRMLFDAYDINRDGFVDSGFAYECFRQNMNSDNAGLTDCFYANVPNGGNLVSEYAPPKTEESMEVGADGLNVTIIQSDAVDASTASAAGVSSHALSDAELDSFGLADGGLKAIVESNFMGATTDIFLRSADTDLYTTNGWDEVELNLQKSAVQVLGSNSEEVSLGTGEYTNDSGDTIEYNGLTTYTFATSTSHNWGTYDSTSDGKITYKIELNGAGIYSPVNAVFQNIIGDSAGGSSTVEVNVTSMNPQNLTAGTTVYTKLTATKHTMKIAIDYSAHISGRVASVFESPMSGSSEWGMWLPTVMNYNANSTYVGCWIERSIKDFEVPVGSGLSKSACATQCKKYGYKYFARSKDNQCHCSDTYGLYVESDTCTCDNDGALGDHNCVYEVGDSLTPSVIAISEEMEVTYYSGATVTICATAAECA